MYQSNTYSSIRLPYDNRSFPGPYPARLDLLWLRKIGEGEMLKFQITRRAENLYVQSPLRLHIYNNRCKYL